MKLVYLKITTPHKQHNSSKKGKRLKLDRTAPYYYLDGHKKQYYSNEMSLCQNGRLFGCLHDPDLPYATFDK